MDKGTCKSCGAAIWWVRTEAGKAMPLDATPQKRVLLAEAGTVRELAQVVTVYVPHWVTCPQADQHRRERPSTQEAPARRPPNKPPHWQQDEGFRGQFDPRNPANRREP